MCPICQKAQGYEICESCLRLYNTAVEIADVPNNPTPFDFKLTFGYFDRAERAFEIYQASCAEPEETYAADDDYRETCWGCNPGPHCWGCNM